MKVENYGKNAGMAFANAFKAITVDGLSAKLSKQNGNWTVTIKEVNK